MVNLARHTQQNFSSSTFCDSNSSFASSSPAELIQQLELQIINQDVIQTKVYFLDLDNVLHIYLAKINLAKL